MVKPGKPGLKTRKFWLVQPGLHPGKSWFNQAFGARVKRKKMIPHHLKNLKRSVLKRRKTMKTSSEIFYKHPKYEIYEANEEGHIPMINRN